MKTILIALTSAALLAACAHGHRPTASAKVEARSGSNVSGTVTFVQESEDMVTISVDLSGLAPGTHGFHLHEKGDCSAADATSAGPHFNPTSMPHGAPTDASRHSGDFGNITADADGHVKASLMSHVLTVKEGPNSVVGRAVVVHADPDDLTSQPAGNAGKRIGCGVVTLAR